MFKTKPYLFKLLLLFFANELKMENLNCLKEGNFF